MNKSFAASVSAIALILSACTEPTAPGAVQQNFTPSYAKRVPPSSTGVSGNLSWAEFHFDGQSLNGTAPTGHYVNGATISSGLLSGLTGASSDLPVPTYLDKTNFFLGRFDNTQTVALLSVPNGGSKYDLAFDFYAIGSWDGIGKQAQSGAFGANLFQVGAVCTGDPAGTIRDIFTSTFSNQMTVQQNYPLTYSSGGGSKALTGAAGSDSLFKGDPTVSVPLFRSVSDAVYKMHFTGNNPCGTGAFTIVFRSYSSTTEQAAFDETWGVDNIVVKTDT
jgi:hypothetical protein